MSPGEITSVPSDMCRAAAVIKMKADMSGAKGFVRGRQEESGAQHRGSPRTQPGTDRPRHPRMRKSRLVMAHRDRETSGICLKSIKENHYFLEKPPLRCHSPEEASSSGEPVPDSNQLCQSQPGSPPQARNPALHREKPRLCLRVSKRQQWVWVPGSPLAFKRS